MAASPIKKKYKFSTRVLSYPNTPVLIRIPRSRMKYLNSSSSNDYIYITYHVDVEQYMITKKGILPPPPPPVQDMAVS